VLRLYVHPRNQPSRDLPSAATILVIAEQSREAIRQRRAIRETFHDSKAITVKKKKTR